MLNGVPKVEVRFVLLHKPKYIWYATSFYRCCVQDGPQVSEQKVSGHQLDYMHLLEIISYPMMEYLAFL